MLQNLFNTLFRGKSLAELGTLCQLKNNFGHKNVSTDVMNSFNHVDNFVRFITEAHTVYSIMELCGMATVDDVPPETMSFSTQKEWSGFFVSLSQKIVNMVIWSWPSVTAIQQVSESSTNDQSVEDCWCLCGQGWLYLYSVYLCQLYCVYSIF